jgi:hypothetical protein
MKRRVLLGVVAAVVVCLGAFFLYQGSLEPAGVTRESREELLNASITKGDGWTIAAERELDGWMVSAACSSDGKATVAVFEPTREGGYEFSTSTNRDREEIIVAGAAVNGNWYDLVWFGGAQTEYAEICYGVGGEQQDPMRYDTSEMGIIAIPNQEKEYTLHVSYVDGAGTVYQ